MTFHYIILSILTIFIKSYDSDIISIFYIPDFVNKFDHIIMMGSSEHIATGNSLFLQSYKHKKNTLHKIFNYCYKYLKNNGNLFYSGLHINKKYYNTFQHFILTRAYGGLLQLNTKDYDILASAKNTKFKHTFTRDNSYDYFLQSKLNKNHFGNSSNFLSSGMLKLLAVSLVLPFEIYQYLYYTLGLWMCYD